MEKKFIGLAGGTGAGKSTLAFNFAKKYPNKIGVIQLDDYFKPDSEIPKYNGIANWDHPDSLYLDKLSHDLRELQVGRSVLINTKNETLNPGYSKTNKRILVEFKPMPLYIVEGYLTLHDKRIRTLLDLSIWLEAPHDTRWDRRTHFKSPNYEKEVLKPMQEKYLEPSKKYADSIIEVNSLSSKQVFKEAERIIKPLLSEL